MQLKSPEKDSPTCSYLNAALVSNELKKNPNTEESKLRAVLRPSPIFVVVLIMEFCGYFRLLAAWSPHLDDVPESLTKYQA